MQPSAGHPPGSLPGLGDPAVREEGGRNGRREATAGRVQDGASDRVLGGPR